MTNTILTGVLVPRTLIGDVCDFGGKASDDCVAGDLVVREGRAVCLTPSQYEPGKIVIPRLTEPHVHLDKCFTVGRIENVGRDLAAAIEAQKADMANWTEADIRHRAARAIKELEKAGCGAVRTHVDWNFQMERTGAPIAWEVLRELATESHMIVQRAALVGIDHMIDGCTAHSLARDIARDGGVMGAFVLDQDNRETGLANMFREADRLGLALGSGCIDFGCTA